MTFKNPNDETIKDYLKNSKNIAVIGLSNKPDRTSYQVAQVLQLSGYKLFPVNPMLAGETILGEPVVATLTDVKEPIDIVDIFRKSDALPDIAREFVKTDAKIFWAQLGIENEEAAQILAENNRKDVVMNRCIKIELNNMA
ncbi:CoA-binding protein [Vagococcus penaei]|uniref:CoA-binding protein n=1 Tax=Vagococcus penaei TaxID=633807 RepID=A0A1Q2D389_9ENTE|nr:CoA-binding protein [Vagococcus penaei]AQP52816.1 CoA-binding protein [Vagococcus penaei]RSU01157.1 CoA-binding protein [Vagococcus penaei]